MGLESRTSNNVEKRAKQKGMTKIGRNEAKYIINHNINGLNALVKRQRLSDCV